MCKRFKDGDFDLMDKERSGSLRKCNNDAMEQLVAENPAKTQEELAGVSRTTISKCLQEMSMIQMEEKWVSHELRQKDNNNNSIGRWLCSQICYLHDVGCTVAYAQTRFFFFLVLKRYIYVKLFE